MAIFRDDTSSRLRRSALRFKSVDEDREEEDETMSGAMGRNSSASTESARQEQDDGQPMDVDDVAATRAPEIDPDILTARRLTKTLLDQGHLSPFPLNSRPVHWDYGSALQLYPLPTSLVLADPEAPAFTLNYMGCCVMNPGAVVDGRRGERARWIEYNVIDNRGIVRSEGG